MTPTAALFLLMMIMPNGETKQYFSKEMTYDACELEREHIQEKVRVRTFKCEPVK